MGYKELRLLILILDRIRINVGRNFCFNFSSTIIMFFSSQKVTFLICLMTSLILAGWVLIFVAQNESKMNPLKKVCRSFFKPLLMLINLSQINHKYNKVV